MTVTSNLTPMVNFLPYFMTKEIVIYQMHMYMKFVFHNLYITPEFTVYSTPPFILCILNYTIKSMIFKISFHLIFQTFFLDVINHSKRDDIGN